MQSPFLDVPRPLSSVRTDEAFIRVSTAGWGVPRAAAERFPVEGTGLERYAARFDAVEINSTFYRSHKSSTYARWADSTGENFRFAVKLPRTITHEARLLDAMSAVAAFRVEAQQLGEKLGPLLVQLPPSLAFDGLVAVTFFAGLRDLWPGDIVCEPRHATWFERDADAMLYSFEVARVAADPAIIPAAGTPGGWAGIAYWRLHGSPKRYYSSYTETELCGLAIKLRTKPAIRTWCVFDNTASGAAVPNALQLLTRLKSI